MPTFKPGDMVLVNDNTFTPGCNFITRMKGQVCEVKGIEPGHAIVIVWEPDKSNCWWFNASDLSPVPNPETLAVDVASLMGLPDPPAYINCSSSTSYSTNAPQGKGDNTMSTKTTSARIKELSLDEDTRLLRKYNVIDNEGDLTVEGVKVVVDHYFATGKDAIVAKLKELDAADQAEAKTDGSEAK